MSDRKKRLVTCLATHCSSSMCIFSLSLAVICWSSIFVPDRFSMYKTKTRGWSLKLVGCFMSLHGLVVLCPNILPVTQARVVIVQQLTVSWSPQRSLISHVTAVPLTRWHEFLTSSCSRLGFSGSFAEYVPEIRAVGAAATSASVFLAILDAANCNRCRIPADCN